MSEQQTCIHVFKNGSTAPSKTEFTRKWVELVNLIEYGGCFAKRMTNCPEKSIIVEKDVECSVSKEIRT